MPCYDARNHEPSVQIKYKSGISPLKYNSLKAKNSWLEAALCAVFNELERRDIASDVLAESSRNGLIGLVDFWAKHKGSDESRIARDLHKYSKDEQAIIRKLLNASE